MLLDQVVSPLNVRVDGLVTLLAPANDTVAFTYAPPPAFRSGVMGLLRAVLLRKRVAPPTRPTVSTADHPPPTMPAEDGAAGANRAVVDQCHTIQRHGHGVGVHICRTALSNGSVA